MKKSHTHHGIVEKELGIPADYQYRALRGKLIPQANWHNNKLAIVKSLLKFNKNMRVLDLGAGSGNLEFAIHNKVREVLAVDYNDEATHFLEAEIKKRKIKNVKTKTLNIENIHQLKNVGLFDVIIMMDVIEHIDMAKIPKIISTLKKLLNKNGKICIITPNYKSTWLMLEWLLDKVAIVPKFEGHQHIAQFHKQNLQQLFLDNELYPVTLRTFNHASFLFPIKGVAERLAITEVVLNVPMGNMLIGVFATKRKK